jgi:hypothetical protein
MFVRPRVSIVAFRLLLATSLVLAAAQRNVFAQAAVDGGANAGGSNTAPQTPTPPIAPQRPAGLMSEPGFLSSAIAFVNGKVGDQTSAPKSGFYPELSNMITGSGWVSVGPGYRHYFSDDRAFFDTSAAVSWRLYKMMQARFELPKLADGHLAVGTQGMWQDDTQVNYFGVGPNIVEDDRSQYRMQTHDIAGYATVTPKDWLSIRGTVGWLGSPKLMDPGGTFVKDFPTTRDAFPRDPAAGLSSQPSLLHSEASIASDTRDHRGHPTSGGLYRAALTNYWDRTDGIYTFHTFEAEALHYVPLADARVVLAFHGWTVAGDAGDGHDIPFYLLPAIGGSRTLRDYHDFQFHDRNLLVLNAESRFAIWQHLDTALFVDAGNVASRFSGLNLDKTSYGAGVRLHNETTTLARLDLAHGAQGWRLNVSTSEPLRLPRVRRQLATIPFAP